LLSFVPYTWNDLSHAASIDGVDLSGIAYHNRNVIFFSLLYIALLWLICFSSSSSAVVRIATCLHFARCALDAWNWHGTDVTAVELQSHRIASQSRHAQL